MVKSKKKSRAVKTPKTQVKFTKQDATLLPRLSLFFFRRPRFTAILWLLIFAFGILSYSTLLKREGFPSVDFPVASISGTYIANDPSKVDANVTKPISEIALKQPGVKTVAAQSFDNFFTIFVQFEEGTDPQGATKNLESAIKAQSSIPAQASIQYSVPYFGPAGTTDKKLDVGISYFDTSGKATTEQIAANAEKFASELRAKNLDLVKEVYVLNPFETATNPATGQQSTIQRTFDRYGMRADNTNTFYNSVLIGVTAAEGADIIKLDDQVRATISEIDTNNKNGYQAEISASNGPSITESISELQRVLLEGLIVVLLVGSLVIAIRASLITVISMVTVLAATIGLLFLIGYTLNVITLFAIILSLSLIVDDTIIMVEAIDAQRKRQKTARDAVEHATRRVSKAMIAATSTAALSFAPLIFVGGILGSFIRSIPVTIIVALVMSLIVALVFIPLFARFILLGKKQMGERAQKEFAAGFESSIARGIAWPMIWAKDSRKKLTLVGVTAVIIGFGFIGAAGLIGKNVVFNIFPPSKDANNLQITLTYPPGTTLAQAEATADKANTIVGTQLNENFDFASYYGVASPRSAPLQVQLIPYAKRDATSPQLIDQLKLAYEGFDGARVTVAQVDNGPPGAPFTIKILSENREASFMLAQDISKFLENKQLTRPSGKVATVTSVTVSNPGAYSRDNNVLNVQVTAEFDGTDTTTLVNLAKSETQKVFTPEKVASYGLDKNALVYDFGQEDENQDSFKTLAIAFPALLAVIFVLLAIQFRSLLQPLLIFLAIPFSLFGITAGLYITKNPFSFFAMLGFFALIGLSIKNTILLTDYANQARRAGMNPVDSAVEALSERFRPLIATSLTAMLSLVPLAVFSPFWEGLAVVLIFGLLSSTFLVVTVFPYYYLGAEFMRNRVSAKAGVAWVVATITAVYVVSKFAPKFVVIVPLLAIMIGVGLMIRSGKAKAKRA